MANGNRAWVVMVSAAAILMITMGARQSLGLFVHPLHIATGLGIASISFSFAIGQFVWGLAQPIFGAIADKRGAFSVLVFGTVLLAVGTALTVFVDSEKGLIFSMGILAAAGAGAGSFSILIGATSSQLPVEKRAFASGFINAGGSMGQFVFAPLLQAIISGFGWVSAMLTMAATTLLSIPIARTMCGKSSEALQSKVDVTERSLVSQLKAALKNFSYLCLHAGFFTCGFHVAFLVTHLPGEVSLCGHEASISANSLSLIGLFNIAGSLAAGALGARYRMKYILAVMYASRAVMIALYMAAPKTEMTFYLFAAGLGFTWLATVPPTAGLVGKLFGTRYMATLLGLAILTHQIGGFLGAWLGGIAIEQEGNYQWMWYADMVLAGVAALVNLPIKEAKIVKESRLVG